MFKLPEFPSIDFSALDLNALRETDLAKRVAAIDIKSIDTDKVVSVVRDAAYLTVGLGVTAARRVRVAGEQVRGLIRNAA